MAKYDEDFEGGDGRRVKRDDNRPDKETSRELLSFIERVERLEEEKAVIGDDIKEIYGEAKGRGYDTKTIRKIIKLRKQDPSARQEEESLLETYMIALGML